jgi:hypothetical protein
MAGQVALPLPLQRVKIAVYDFAVHPDSTMSTYFDRARGFDGRSSVDDDAVADDDLSA